MVYSIKEKSLFKENFQLQHTKETLSIVEKKIKAFTQSFIAIHQMK